MLRVFLLTGLFLSFASTEVDARTIRYEFDIIDSVIDFGRLIQEVYDPSDPNPTGPPADPAIGAMEYTAFVAARHPFRAFVGQTGSVVFELEHSSSSSHLHCTFGFLCPSFPTYDVLDPLSSSSLGFTAGFSSGDIWTMVATPTGDGTFSGFDDDRVFENVEWNGGHYFWTNPRASFTFANLFVSEIQGAPVPVPLPTAAWFLAAGIVALGFKTRRRTA